MKHSLFGYRATIIAIIRLECKHLNRLYENFFNFSNSFVGIGPTITHSYLEFPNIFKGIKRICVAFYFLSFSFFFIEHSFIWLWTMNTEHWTRTNEWKKGILRWINETVHERPLKKAKQSPTAVRPLCHCAIEWLLTLISLLFY